MSKDKETYKRYQYDKAPLLEAIFEAKFSIESFDSAQPGQFFEKIRNKYPQKNDLSIITFTVGTAANVSPSQLKDSSLIQAPVLQAWNEERTSCLQIGPGIIAANEKKYVDWENFTPSVRLLLKSYFECAKPIETKKVGFRCINRFLIPEDNVVLTDYFKMGLALPNTLLGSKGFDITVLKDDSYKNFDLTARVRFASDSLRTDEKGVAVILDIDSFVTKNINTKQNSILETTTACHDYLKQIFESVLQNKTRHLIGGVLR